MFIICSVHLSWDLRDLNNKENHPSHEQHHRLNAWSKYIWSSIYRYSTFSTQPEVKYDTAACDCITAGGPELPVAVLAQIQRKSAGDDTFLPAITLNNLENNRLLGDSLRTSRRKGLMLTFSRGRGQETKTMHPHPSRCTLLEDGVIS